MVASFKEFTKHELDRLDSAGRIDDPKLRPGQLLNWVLRGKGVHVPVTGLVLEFGVFNGQSINKLGRSLAPQPVFGFDSFEGLPEDWDVGNTVIKADAFDRKGSLPEVEPNVVLIKGWFDQTLPHFIKLLPDPIRLLHVDCDIYSSTRTIFQLLGDRIVPGTIIVFDELINYPTYEEGELKAFYELVTERDLGFEWFPTFGGVRRTFDDYQNMKAEARDFKRDPEAGLIVTRVGSKTIHD
jgi:hypothetical protein